MEPIKIFLNSSTLDSTDGNFGIVSAITNYKTEFDKEYINKDQVLVFLQDELNRCALELVNLPAEADKTTLTSKWQTINDIFLNIKTM
jgi:hypothetical protein